METKNVDLKIHKLSQAQYERELAAGAIDEYALYLTPDEGTDPGDAITLASAKTYTDEQVSPVSQQIQQMSSMLESSLLYVYAQLYTSTFTTSGDGAVYTATVDGITELTEGMSFMLIPHVASTTNSPKLNVNGWGEKVIRRRLSSGTSTTVAGSSENWIGANKPVRVTYDGTYWIVDLVRPSATDIYGVIPIAAGGTGASTADSALANLGLTTESWTFTLADGSTVTKAVYVG